MVTGALGLVYWIVAEQILPTAEAGRASAVISSATVLATLACLSLGGVYERFLPVAGGKSRQLVFGGYLLTTTVALTLGTGFVVCGFGDRILHTTTERITFPLMVAALAIYALTDPILIGLRASRAVAWKNISLSIVKVVPLVAIGSAGSAFALTSSWSILAALITSVFVIGVVKIVHARRSHSADDLPSDAS